MTSPRGLHTLARLHGVQTAYHDHAGQRVGADPEALMAVLRAMGVPVHGAADIPAALARRRRRLWEEAVPPVVVAWLPDPEPFTLRLPEHLAEGAVEVTVALEEGGTQRASRPAGGGEPIERAGLAGRRYAALEVPLPVVPAGYHDLVVEVDGGSRRYRSLLVAAPRRSAGWEVLPGTPDWGVFAPLHALWEEAAPHRIPNFGHLESLARPVAELGGSVVGTLPLLATFLDEPYDPSPYAPVSKLFWNELYAEPRGGSGGRDTAIEGPRVALREAMAARRAVLESEAAELWDDGGDAEPAPTGGPGPTGETGGGAGLRVPADLSAFVVRNPDAPDYARFRAATEAYGPWPRWPDRLRARDLRPGDYDLETARYHLYAQWQAERQLAEVEERVTARGVGLYLDLPLGVHPHGYDVWRDRDQFASGVTVGAPPDPLAAHGQDWGFHPPHPEASRRDGHRYFIAAIRKHLRFARVLRIDHVMQLHRMFWVPDGDASEGVYVRYPHEELYAVLCLESHRAGSVIVGEDLGTVPRAVRRGMRRHGVPGTYVVQFSLRESAAPGGDADAAAGDAPEDGSDTDRKALVPGRVPKGALAAIGTHDTPTFAAWWTGRDAEIRAERGLTTPEEAERQVAGRRDLREKLRRGLRDEIEFEDEFEDEGGVGAEDARAGLAVQEALYRLLGRSRAGLVLANMEDLWMETEPQNVPGTPASSNWRRRARRPVDAVGRGPAKRLLTTLNAAREGRQ